MIEWVNTRKSFQHFTTLTHQIYFWLPRRILFWANKNNSNNSMITVFLLWFLYRFKHFLLISSNNIDTSILLSWADKFCCRWTIPDTRHIFTYRIFYEVHWFRKKLIKEGILLILIRLENCICTSLTLSTIPFINLSHSLRVPHFMWQK